MKYKSLAVLLVVITLLGLGLTVYSKRHVIFPSQQMRTLRQLEVNLGLPKPTYRYEVDLGYNKDWKGAQHYDRHIALSYKDSSILGMLRTKLLKDSWQEHSVATTGSYNYFLFTKDSGDAERCVSGYTQPKDTDGITLYISLEASGEYSCKPTISALKAHNA